MKIRNISMYCTDRPASHYEWLWSSNNQFTSKFGFGNISMWNQKSNNKRISDSEQRDKPSSLPYRLENLEIFSLKMNYLLCFDN